MQPLEQGEKCEYLFGERNCQCCKCSYKLSYKRKCQELSGVKFGKTNNELQKNFFMEVIIRYVR